MGATSIEWTDFSVNPLRAKLGVGNGHYCEKVSPGCKNCYSSRLQPRFRMPQFQEQRGSGVEHWLDRSKLVDVLKRRKPTKWFWCDMTDMFGDWVPVEWIALCFAAMAATPWHTHQVLTKRPARMRDVVRELYANDGALLMDAAEDLAAEISACHIGQDDWKFPLPNVWLGTSVEDQRRADERIPLLLEVPAVVRFLSVEPLLGPVDLQGWGDDAPPAVGPEWDSVTWETFPWESWIPETQRELISNFWSDKYQRGPASWLKDHRIQRVPRTGARVTFGPPGAGGWLTTNKMAPTGTSGRYVHMWNNIGRVVTDTGEILCTGGGSGSGWLSRWLTPSGYYRHKLNWVIVGGESGNGARPCAIEWLERIVEQCRAAAVPAFVKQLGAFVVSEQRAFLREDLSLGTDEEAKAHGFNSRWLWRAGLGPNNRKGSDMTEWPESLRVRQFPEVRA